MDDSEKEVVQVGRFLLQKKDNLDGWERLMFSGLGPKRGPRLLIPTGCENPDDDQYRCRAVTGSGERCSRGRGIFNFFCGRHDPVSKMCDRKTKTLKAVKEALKTIGFRGEVIKFQYYSFVFFGKNGTVHRSYTGHKKVDEVSIGEWLRKAMFAEDVTYMEHRCHVCKAKFRIIDGAGKMCSCGTPYCGKCGERHLESRSHKTMDNFKKAMSAFDSFFDSFWRTSRSVRP